MTDHDDLTRALRAQADTVDADGPTFDDVRGRARQIRRRRRAIAATAAATVLAIAVPVGLSVGETPRSNPVPPVATRSAEPAPGPTTPADPTPTPTSSPSRAAERPTQQVRLTPDVQELSRPPGIAYLFDGAINLPDGSRVPVSADYDDLAALGDEWLALRLGRRQDTVDRLSSTGEILASYPANASLAVSADGTVVAWGTKQGAVLTLVAGGEPLQINGPGDLHPGAEPVGVVGSQTCLEAESKIGGCTVVYNADDGAWSSSSHGITDRLEPFVEVAAITSEGATSGMTSVADDGSCSAVRSRSAVKPLWTTCDYTLGRFSPDGRYILGHPAYLDGIGDGWVAVLDASTGAVLADFKPVYADADQWVLVNSTVWDTDATALSTLFFQDQWYVMRLGPDGYLGNVPDGALDGAQEEFEVPLRFAARP